MSDNPMVALNQAVAVAMAQGPAEGLALLEKRDRDLLIKDHYRLDTVRAHLLERSGRITERDYLLLKIARLRAE